MSQLDYLYKTLLGRLDSELISLSIAYDELTMVVPRETLLRVMQILRDEEVFSFDQIIDVCGVDYLRYGASDWDTDEATEEGFSRGVYHNFIPSKVSKEERFGVVYHLLSVKKNHRLRVKVFLAEDDLMVPSIHHLWEAANWFEREAYDLYGILFEGHHDLRRILTDYGFIGHPFRKDFPLSGYVEVRYDKTQAKVVYDPVDIVPRILVPKVIREDNRYLGDTEVTHDRA